MDYYKPENGKDDTRNLCSIYHYGSLDYICQVKIIDVRTKVRTKKRKPSILILTRNQFSKMRPSLFSQAALTAFF